MYICMDMCVNRYMCASSSLYNMILTYKFSSNFQKLEFYHFLKKFNFDIIVSTLFQFFSKSVKIYSYEILKSYLEI